MLSECRLLANSLHHEIQVPGHEESVHVGHVYLFLLALLSACMQTAGEEQANLVQQLLHKQQQQGMCIFVDARVHVDCFGVPRFVTATRAP